MLHVNRNCLFFSITSIYTCNEGLMKIMLVSKTHGSLNTFTLVSLPLWLAWLDQKSLVVLSVCSSESISKIFCCCNCFFSPKFSNLLQDYAWDDLTNQLTNFVSDMKVQLLGSFLATHIWMSSKCFTTRQLWPVHWEWPSLLLVSLLLSILTQVSSWTSSPTMSEAKHTVF